MCNKLKKYGGRVLAVLAFIFFVVILNTWDRLRKGKPKPPQNAGDRDLDKLKGAQDNLDNLKQVAEADKQVKTSDSTEDSIKDWRKS